MTDSNIPQPTQQENVIVPQNTQSKKKMLSTIFLLLFLIGLFTFVKLLPKSIIKLPGEKKEESSLIDQKFEVKKFASEAEYQNYLENSQSLSYFGRMDLRQNSVAMESNDTAIKLNSPSFEAAGSSAPDRVSQTNTQVASVDEPDIVKTNGNQIFLSDSYNYWRNANTRIINSFPVNNLSQIDEIDQNGDLLLDENILIILGNNYDSPQITGYDIKNPQDPQKLWSFTVSKDTQIDSARMFDNKLYLVTKTNVYKGSPCLIEPLSNTRVMCTDIYYPGIPTQTDSTFTAFKIDPKSGEVDKQISFTGSYNSVVYMNQNNLYIGNSFEADQVELMYQFFNQNKDLVGEEVIAKLEKLMSYDISSQAKMVELEQIFSNLYNTGDKDEILRIENEMENRSKDFISQNLRNFQKTGITKINLDNFDIVANGQVPGYFLNQFSLDEYEDNLRIATTSRPISNWSSNSETANDLYILDKNLKEQGSVKDLGLEGESIFGVRFIEDKGYIVTFRQTDPLYIIDLKDPKNPQKTGELKIPGYSSYLHPLEKNLLLGIGEENRKVKISLFDISDSTNPLEIDKYQLDSYWSEASSNHHAFLQDDKFKIFFLPATNDGYVFSYENNKLNLKKAIADTNAKRALFIEDNLYIVGQEGIVVFDENNWEKVNSLEFEKKLEPIEPIIRKDVLLFDE